MSYDAPTAPTESMRTALAVPPGPVNLAAYDPSARPAAPVQDNSDLRNDVARLQSLQDRFWAESTAGGNANPCSSSCKASTPRARAVSRSTRWAP